MFWRNFFFETQCTHLRFGIIRKLKTYCVGILIIYLLNILFSFGLLNGLAVNTPNGRFFLSKNAHQSFEQSFLRITGSKKIETSEDASQQLFSLCDSNRYPFLACRYNSDGSIESRSGVFGLGIVVNIVNDVNSGIKVYKNCRNLPGTPFSFTDDCLVLSSEQKLIPVFVKTVRETATQDNNFSYLSSVPAITKESLRTRDFAFLTYPSTNIPIGPAVYYLLETKTGEPHHLHNFAYIQQLLIAETAFDLQGYLVAIEKQSFNDNINSVLDRLYDCIKASQQNSKSPKHLKSNILKKTFLFNRSVVRAQKEIWLRARLRLALAHTILTAAEQLWRLGVVHCDLHWGNIMILKTRITSETELLNLIDRGIVIIPNFRLYYSETRRVPKIVKEYIKVYGGIDAFLLKMDHVRLIDTAYAMDLKKLLFKDYTDSSLTNISPLPLDPDPSLIEKEESVQHACRGYRGGREEDLTELYRNGFFMLFGYEKYKYKNLWNESIQTLTQKNTVPDSGNHANIQNSRKSLLSRILNLTNKMKSTSSLHPPSADTVLINGVKAFGALLNEVDAVTTLFTTINERIIRLREYTNCKKTSDAWPSLTPQTRMRICRSPTPDKVLQQHIPGPCSFRNVRQGGRFFRSFFEDAAKTFPPVIRMDWLHD